MISPMPQTAKKILQWSALGLIASIAAIVLFLLLFDWNHAKPWLNARVSDAGALRFKASWR